MVSLVPITTQNALVFRAIRLRALQDAPSAFRSTYATELQLSDADWAQRIERWNGERGVGFLAMDGDAACGIAGSLVDDEDDTRAHLVSMWTAPTHRRRGIGCLLVEGVIRWASLNRVRMLYLLVTSNNETAIKFYEHLGFRDTGTGLPYANDPAFLEYEMVRSVS
jgi:ribosomal protein S18 acetylase RimI-like enzyme